MGLLPDRCSIFLFLSNVNLESHLELINWDHTNLVLEVSMTTVSSRENSNRCLKPWKVIFIYKRIKQRKKRGPWTCKPRNQNDQNTEIHYVSSEKNIVCISEKLNAHTENNNYIGVTEFWTQLHSLTVTVRFASV